jgi:ankyrin repeat protein
VRQPLHQAAQNGHVKMVKLLIRLKSFVDVRAEDNVAPLWLAAQKGYTEIC